MFKYNDRVRLIDVLINVPIGSTGKVIGVTGSKVFYKIHVSWDDKELENQKGFFVADLFELIEDDMEKYFPAGSIVELVEDSLLLAKKGYLATVTDRHPESMPPGCVEIKWLTETTQKNGPYYASKFRLVDHVHPELDIDSAELDLTERITKVVAEILESTKLNIVEVQVNIRKSDKPIPSIVTRFIN